MRQPGGLKFSHPVPYPRWRKSARQSWVCSGAGAEQGLERIPLFWGCLMSRVWRFISKVGKAVLSEGGLRLLTVLKPGQKQTNKSWFRVGWGLDPRPPSVQMAARRLALDLGHLSHLGWAKNENKLQVSLIFLPTTRKTPTPNYSFSILRNHEQQWKWEPISVDRSAPKKPRRLPRKGRCDLKKKKKNQMKVNRSGKLYKPSRAEESGLSFLSCMFTWKVRPGAWRCVSLVQESEGWRLSLMDFSLQPTSVRL